VNTTLTLAALTLRLSRELLPSEPQFATSINGVYVMNQTGAKIKAFVSNYAGISGANNAEILGPGEILRGTRKNGTIEAVSVYRLKYNSVTEYVDVPVLFNAKPGSLLTV